MLRRFKGGRERRKRFFQCLQLGKGGSGWACKLCLELLPEFLWLLFQRSLDVRKRRIHPGHSFSCVDQRFDSGVEARFHFRKRRAYGVFTTLYSRPMPRNQKKYRIVGLKPVLRRDPLQVVRQIGRVEEVLRFHGARSVRAFENWAHMNA